MVRAAGRELSKMEPGELLGASERPRAGRGLSHYRRFHVTGRRKTLPRKGLTIRRCGNLREVVCYAYFAPH